MIMTSRLDQLQIQFRQKLKLEANLTSVNGQALSSGVPKSSRIQQLRKPIRYSSTATPTLSTASYVREVPSHRVISPPSAGQHQAVQSNNGNSGGTKSVAQIPLSYGLLSKAREFQRNPVTTDTQTLHQNQSSSQAAPVVSRIRTQTSNVGGINKASAAPATSSGQSSAVTRSSANVASRGTKSGSSSSSTFSSLSGNRKDDLPCAVCGRTFSPPDRLEKHETICARTKEKARKKFDSTRQRFKNQPKDLVHAYQSALKEPADEEEVKAEQQGKNKKKSNWREKHDNFIATIRSAQARTGSTPSRPNRIRQSAAAKGEAIKYDDVSFYV